MDVSFPRAWRAEAGLDQIVQVAGRVNRDGEMLPALGQVVVFTPEGYPPPAEIRGLIGDMARMAAKFDDLQSPQAIHSYFSEVYWRLDAGLDAKKIIADFTVDRPLHGGVDRNLDLIDGLLQRVSRPLHGGVDRNIQSARYGRIDGRRPLHGGVDRNLNGIIAAENFRSRPFHGGVDRNLVGHNG